MRKNNLYLLFIGFIIASIFSSCSEDSLVETMDNRECIEKKIAVVLPSRDGMQANWKRIFTLLDHNMQVAFGHYPAYVKFSYEFYDEENENLDELGNALANRDDIYAVIGGLYSENAEKLALKLVRGEKTFMTTATTEELVRAFASSGLLWAMTETDITQCEVLLSKVVNYGGKSVALIADDTNKYGKTFVDWFGFQALELGLTNKGIFNGEFEEAVNNAFDSGADYIICVPSVIDEIRTIVEKYNRTDCKSKLLFSDIGYGSDVVERLGSYSEGIEGVCFGADPETGFDISFRTYFGVEPTVGAAQLYDAGMLLAYSAWYQHLHNDVSLTGALRSIVDGRDFNMGSWMGEDMRNVVDALSAGKSPYVRGASGWLDFDSKVYTNVLASVYYNYKVYDGHYIILDYNTADGGNRTDATLAGWNWKASQQQEFSDGSNIQYGPLKENKALLVAASSEWKNYRHQADVLSIYQLLKEHGYSDEDIILIAEDDIANYPLNPTPGEIRVKPMGENVYKDVRIDYKLSDISPNDFINILKGKTTSATPKVIEGNENTNIFIFWSGHGMPNSLVWNVYQYLRTGDLASTLCEMAEERRYRKLAFFTEACYSGSVFEKCTGNKGMIFFTAANPFETSKADMFSPEMGIWMSNRFTSTFLESVSFQSVIPLHDLYNRLFISTVGSHVMVYNAENFGNLHTSTMDEFINP